MKVAHKQEFLGDAGADEKSEVPVLCNVLVKVKKDGPLTKLSGFWVLQYGRPEGSYSEEKFEFKGATFPDWRMLGNARIFKSYEDFLEKAGEHESLAFILSVTNVSKDLFDYAEQHPGTSVPIILDMMKYVRWLGQPSSLHPESMAEDKIAKIKAVSKRFVFKKLSHALSGYKAIATITRS